MKEEKPIWMTLDNFDGTDTFKQHAFISATRGKWYEEEYEGNRSLCGKFGISEDGESYVNLKTVVSEPIRENCCKTCWKIYQKKSKPIKL